MTKRIYVPSSSRCHIPAGLRAAACLEYFHACQGVDKNIERPEDVVRKRKIGCTGDAAVTRAYNVFMQAFSVDGRLIGLPRGLQRKDFRRLVNVYWPSWVKTRECPSRSRRRVVGLNHAEALELATLLTEPVNIKGSMNRFKTVGDAMKVRPRIAALVEKSRVGSHTSFLEKWLLQEVPWLKRQPEDRAPRLCLSTLKKRQHCADIWGGRVPWRRVRRRHGTAKDRARARQEKSPTSRMHRRPEDEDDDDMIDMMWDPAWYGPFTFMLDATRLELREGTVKDVADVFVNSDHVYGPFLAEPDAPVSQTLSLMIYTVIHKHFGMVVRPGVMLTGSRLKATRGAGTRSQQFQKQGVPTW